MTSFDSFSELNDTLTRVIHRAVEVEQSPVDFGNGTILTASDIHLIDMAGRFPEENLKSLAERLGVTKGAISQMVSKLEGKGYFFRVKRDENKKNVFLELTPEGREIFSWHTELHNRLHQEFLFDVAQVSEQEIQATIGVLRRFEKMLVKSLEIGEDDKVITKSRNLLIMGDL